MIQIAGQSQELKLYMIASAAVVEPFLIFVLLLQRRGGIGTATRGVL